MKIIKSLNSCIKAENEIEDFIIYEVLNNDEEIDSLVSWGTTIRVSLSKEDKKK
jgi:hypothetical protein